MAAIKDVLNKFRAISSIDIAAVISNDSDMQIESFSRGTLDVDEVCALASTGMRMSEALGGATARGVTRQAVLQYASGVIVLEPISQDLTMMVVSTDPNSVGKIRYLSRRYREDLINAVENV